MSSPKVILPDGFTRFDEHIMPSRGYLSHAMVEVNGQRYPVYFVDPVRLAQDLQASAEAGDPFFAEPGMIVLSEVTLDAINHAVAALDAEGFFQSLVSVPPDPAAKP